MADELVQTFLEEYNGAKDELGKGRYKNSDSYSKPILKETCGAIKNGIKKIREISELPEEIKKAIE